MVWQPKRTRQTDGSDKVTALPAPPGSHSAIAVAYSRAPTRAGGGVARQKTRWGTGALDPKRAFLRDVMAIRDKCGTHRRKKGPARAELERGKKAREGSRQP